jgi:thiamine-phosphate pyrophosphorylase
LPSQWSVVSARPLTLPRLYAILDVDLVLRSGVDPERVCQAWFEAGVRLVQLRAKSLPSGDLLALADRLAARARAAGARFVVNDRADVAVLSGADGVHVGQEDLRPAAIRRGLWRSDPGRSGLWRERAADLLIGLSTHNEPQLEAALGEPASYLAIGPVFATATKARPDPVIGLDGVRRAASQAAASGRPLVAIGGIDQSSARAVIEAGADVVAMAADLTLPDPGARARAVLDALGD